MERSQIIYSVNEASNEAAPASVDTQNALDVSPQGRPGAPSYLGSPMLVKREEVLE